MSFSHHERALSFTSPLGADKLLVESFRGTEGLSQLFEFNIELLATLTTRVHPKDLIGKRVTLEVAGRTGNKRPFNGMVASLEVLGRDWDFQTFQLRMVPMLWLLSLNVQTRVFQDKSVSQIIKDVLEPYSITPDDRCTGMQRLDYCTQYRETDLAFITRLMEQHGLYYLFTHTASDHKLVLGNKSSGLPPLTPSTFRYALDTLGERSRYESTIETFTTSTSLVTGQHTFWDYRFTQYAGSASTPANSATRSPLGSNAHEMYDYAEASAYSKTDHSDQDTQQLQTSLQDVQRDREDQQATQCSGTSDISIFAAGTTFNLKDHPIEEANMQYLLTQVEHQSSQLPSFRTQDQDGGGSGSAYRNSFRAQPASLTYRTPKVTPRPRVQGVVTGKVVAPSGDESFLDKYGRVCVQFWWDRHRKPNTTDNTLLRVAQQWAGKGWGTYFWPRLGDEVLIDFLDGDPDNPIVVGSLYNGVNMPRYDPAGKYTRSGILTQSSKNGGKANANELRFEDLKGSEQIFINAEKDFDTHVENEEHKQIDSNQHLSVGGDKLVVVSGDHHNEVKKDVVEKIGGDHHLAITGKELVSITGDQGVKVDGASSLAVSMDRGEDYSMGLSQKVGMNHTLNIGMNSYMKTGMSQAVEAGVQVYLKGGMSVIIEAGMEICLKAAGGFITIGPSGVMISGLLVMINSGGAAVPGTPGQAESPKAPEAPKSPKAPSWPGDDPRA